MAGGKFLVFGLSSILLTALLSVKPIEAETSSECIQRLSEIANDSLVQVYDGEIRISPKALQKQPLLLRNLVAHLWMNPYLASFFGAREAGLKALYEADRAFEFRQAFVELDRMQSYSLAEIQESLSSLGLTGEDFVLDMSALETKGVVLKFLGKTKKSDFYNRFALAWAKWLLRQTAPIAVKPMINLNINNTRQVPEDAFVLHQAKAKMQSFVVEQLLLSWAPFEKLFKENHSQVSVEVPVNSHTETWSFMIRAADDESLIIEISAGGNLPKAGLITLNGQSISWIKKSQGQNVGLVKLSRSNRFRVEWRSLQENGQAEFRLDVSN